MHLLKLGAAALNGTPLDWDGNRDNVLAAIEEARAAGVGLLCLPELCLSGYGCEDAFLAPGTSATAWQVLEEIVPASRGLVVAVGLPVPVQHALYNAAALLVDGRIAGLAAKKFLAGDGLHYEPRWFKPWPVGLVTTLERGGESHPFGDLHFDVGGVRIGFEICEDAWVGARPGAALARKGMDVLLNPSASHFAFRKQEVRERYVLEGSRAFAVSYVYTNHLGNEAGRAIYDGGNLIASAGKLAAAGPRFSFRPRVLTTAVVDLDLTRMHQAQLASYQPDLAPDPARVDVPFSWPAVEPEVAEVARAAWESGAGVKEEEFTRAIALALRDYAAKSRSRGFVVSLSGGADSAACACLVRAMVDLGAAELGRDAFLASLGRDDLRDDEAMRELLTTAYQATRNSGEVTRRAAREVAAAVGARHHELDVDPLYRGYVELIEQALGRDLAWETDDVALQNIQARVRAPSIWMFANLEGKLLLATSNRSEAAVGYATMDGDTAGGLAPIAGIDKAFLRRWLRWMESEGPEGVGPFPALGAINAQQPTAELRPPERGQTDEGDLMPYEILDLVERAAIRDKKTPLEIYRLLAPRHPGIPAGQLVAWLERFFGLWSRNQWKRERLAPAFHVDDENLDPKTWFRFPILSGGYRRELAELRREVLGEGADRPPRVGPTSGPQT